MADAVHRERTAEEQAQYDKLVGTPIPKLIPKLAVPTVLSMMITMLYNLADSYFVGKLGTSASASIGIVMAVSHKSSRPRSSRNNFIAASSHAPGNEIGATPVRSANSFIFVCAKAIS